MADWASLQHDLLVITAGKLEKFEDFAAFGTVCKAWNAAAANKEFFKNLWLRERTPFLLLPARNKNDEIRDLYSWIKGDVVASIRVPNSRKRKCFESLGWFLAVGNDRSMCLVDPFSKVEIRLPPQSSLSFEPHPCQFVLKMCLSARPDESPHFIVAIIFRWMLDLAFWWPGETSWHTVVCPGEGFFQDVTYHSGQFYSIDSVSKIRIHKLVEGQLTASVVAVHKAQRLVPFGFCAIGQQTCIYTTKTDEDCLLVVIRTYHEYNKRGTYVNYYDEEKDDDDDDSDEEKDDEGNSDEEKDDEDDSDEDDYDDDDSDKGEYRGRYIKTSKFEVYEFNFPLGTWTKVDNLGNMAIFVSNVNATTAVDASRFHGVVKPNHIYFMDDGHPYEGDSHLDRGTYNMENKTIDPFCHEEKFHSKRSRPTWFIPIMWPLSR